MEIEWSKGSAEQATVRGRRVCIEEIGEGLVSWSVGGLFKADAARGLSRDTEEAKRMAILVADALPEVTP